MRSPLLGQDVCRWPPQDLGVVVVAVCVTTSGRYPDTTLQGGMLQPICGANDVTMLSSTMKGLGMARLLARHGDAVLLLR